MPVQLLMNVLIFALLCLSAHQIGRFFARFKLPYITGYLAAGALISPSALGLMAPSAKTDLQFVNQAALGIIAFIAGSELYLREIRRQLKTILSISSGIIVSMLILGTVSIYYLTAFIPFTEHLNPTSRLAVAILGATILLALSPPSTIAIIKEVRAKGTFTRTILSVTVAIDVAIVFCFAISVNVVEPLLSPMKHFDGGFLGGLMAGLLVALGGGFLVGFTLAQLIHTKLPQYLKMLGMLGIGYLVFVGARAIQHLPYIPFEIHVEPLLTAMIGGIYITNFTKYRDSFEELLHEISPIVYVVFFTLTGLSVEFELLWKMLPFAGLLFLVRIGGIFVGSYSGSYFAKAPLQCRRFSWMAFITQAGIALGLSAEAARHFPQLGVAFQNLIVSVILLNEVFGPLFLKHVLRQVGETNEPDSLPKRGRRAAILGIDGQTVALARQLVASGWDVVMADTDDVRVELIRGRSVPAGLSVQHFRYLSGQTIGRLFEKPTDVFVAACDDDLENFQACRLVYDRQRVRMVARLNSAGSAEQFRALDVFVLDQTSAMVNLLEQAVLAPQSTALFLHQDETRKIQQITVSNPDMDQTLIRDIRLPADVLILDITRGEEVIVPNGFTRLKLGDEITLIGHADDLDFATLRLGY